MIMHPLRRGEKGAASGKQFTSNVFVGYWLFVRLAVCVPLCLECVFVKSEDFKQPLFDTQSVCGSEALHRFVPPLSFITFSFLVHQLLSDFACSPSSDCPTYLHTCFLVYSAISWTSMSISSPAPHVFHSQFKKKKKTLPGLLLHSSFLTCWFTPAP